LPLLSLDPESVFGSGHTLIQRIPDSDLSCPEEYLEKIAPPPSKTLDDDDEDDDEGDVETGEVENETVVRSCDVFALVRVPCFVLTIQLFLYCRRMSRTSRLPSCRARLKTVESLGDGGRIRK
jgi:hypothetical protein